MINAIWNLVLIIMSIAFIAISLKNSKLDKEIYKVKKEIQDNQDKTIELLIKQNNSLKKIINDAVNEVKDD